MTQKTIYNPAMLTKEELKASFVIRQHELDDLFQVVQSQPTSGALQHVLILGQRGMGKTFLGLRLLIEIADDPNLSQRWQPVPFFEESYGVTDIAGLWLTALRHLSDATRDLKWRTAADELERDESNADRLAAAALSKIIDFRNESGLQPIFFIENLDEMFEQLPGVDEISKLRAVLQERSDFLIIGTAKSTFEAIGSRSAPFYEFFRLVRLNGIGPDDLNAFLKQLSSRGNNDTILKTIESEPGRLEVIRRFTGGNPRLITLAFRLMLESPTGAARDDLERLIDDQTPYFKARIESLSPQLRSVFHALAEGWAPMLAKEVAQKTRLSSSQASANLKKLAEQGFVETVRFKGKKRLRYQVLERFYNIYYLLRFTRDQKERLEKLIDFIEQMFGQASIGLLAQATMSRLRVAEVLSSDDLATMTVLAPRIADHPEENGDVAIIHEMLLLGNAHEADFPPEFLAAAWDTSEQPENFQAYVEATTRALAKNPDDFSVAIKLATAHVRLDNFSVADKILDDAISRQSDDKVLFLLITSRGLNSFAQRQLEKSEENFRAALDIDQTSPFAWSNLGQALLAQNKLAEAEDNLNFAISSGAISAEIFHLLGQTQIRDERFSEAAESLLRGLELEPDNKRIHLDYALALANDLRFSAAKKKLTSLTNDNIPTGKIWLALGRKAEEAGEANIAENAFGEALKFKASSGSAALALLQYKELHVSDGSVDDALGILSLALESDPDHPYVKLVRILYLFGSGQKDLAAKELKSAEGESFHSPTLVAFKSMINNIMGNEPAGTELSKRAIELDPDDFMAMAARADVLSDKGHHEEALELARRMLETDAGLDAVTQSLFVNEILISAAKNNYSTNVLRLMEDTHLKETLEPLYHAIRLLCGEEIDPLPIEIMDVVLELRDRLAPKELETNTERT